VTETTIQDKYEIVLNATYETDVPAPVVVAEPASINLPDMNPGDVFTGEITYTNYGLIRADDLQFTFPETDEYFKYEILAKSIPDRLGAKEFFTVPYRITCLKSFLDTKRRSSSCYCYSNGLKTVYVWICINGKWFKAGIDVPIVFCYGQCGGGSIGTAIGGSVGGGSTGSTFVPPSKTISGVLCPPDRVCPVDDPCCEMDASEETGSHVDLMRGEYRDEAVDLSVKVPGYLLEVKRSYYDYQWHFSDLTEKLVLEYGSDSSSPKLIKKHGVSYKKAATDSNVYTFDETRKIFMEEDGFRWTDGTGNWRLYDSAGKIISYGNRNQMKVSYIYDNQNRVIGLADNSGQQVLWYEYTGEYITAVSDIQGRRVTYDYISGDRLTKVTDLLGNEWTYEYNVWGGLLSKKDPMENITNIRYNPSMYVESVESPDGTVKTFDYAMDYSAKEYYASVTYSTGKIREVWIDQKGDKVREDINGKTVEKTIYDGRKEIHIDASGNETVREFDEWHNLIREIHPDGSSVSYQYELKFGNLLKMTDERGIVTKYEYDNVGNRIKKIEAYQTEKERITEYTYDEKGNLKTEKIVGDVNTADAVTTMVYDENGNLKSVTDPEGNVTAYSHNIMGQVLTKTDSLGKVWTYNYDSAGNLKSVSDPLGNISQYFYDASGNKIKETDPSGNITLHEYDYAGRLRKTTDAFGKLTEFVYDSEGKLIKRIDPEAKEVQQGYDADGRLATMTDGNGNVITYEYQDSPGASCSTCSGGAGTDQPTKIIYPTFAKTFQYDERGRKISETDILSDTEQYLTQFEYDAAGNLISQIDKENRRTGYAYDKLGRKISESDAVNGVTEYFYDNRNNLISLKDAKGNLTRFAYDRNSRMTKEIRPMGEETVYEYNVNGSLIRKTDAKGQKHEYSYDDAGRMTEIRYYNASAVLQKTVKFDYYPEGMLKSYHDGITSAAYQYDALHRKVSESVNYGSFALSYAYTYYANGLKKIFTGPDGITCSYTYDSNNQLSGITIPGTGTISYNAYQWNRPAEIILPGGVKKSYTYDPLMRISNISVKDPAQAVLMNYSYSYDKMNNIVNRQTEHGPYAYAYDPLYRLKTADNAALTDEAYTYDSVGNRITDSSVTGAWTYNENNELLAYNGYTFEYDANGNMVKKTGDGETLTYIYNMENRLEKVKKADASVIGAYYYDPFGRRLWKEVSGVKTYFAYADEGLIGEYNAAGQVIKTYGYKPNSIWTTDPVFMKQGSEYYFYHNDHLGTPVMMTDVGGMAVWSIRYNAFGVAEVDVSSSVVNSLRFPGQYNDIEISMYYNFHRFYIAKLGRYLEADPIGIQGGTNHLYSYIKDNPINYEDHSGLKGGPCKWHGTIKIKAGSLPIYGYAGVGAGTADMELESDCCCRGNYCTKASGTYRAYLGLASLGGPISYSEQSIELEGPVWPSIGDPVGEFVISSGNVSDICGDGIGYSGMVTGSLISPLGISEFKGIDIGFSGILGKTSFVGFGYKCRCCKKNGKIIEDTCTH